MRIFKFIYKFILFSVFISLLFFIIRERKLISYGWMQAKGQIKIIINTRPITEILEDKTFPDSLKYKLRLIQEIKKYAFDSLGINPSSNYSDLYDQHGRPLIWVITASKPFELIPYEWDFPVLGKLSYKGFFIRSKADEEAAHLKKQGYDVETGTAGGWSTLGLFSDPVLSSMLSKTEGGLANLIIHELTHSSIYISDSVNFNENLANFTGDIGAKKFLIQRFGIQSKQYETYQRLKKESMMFSEFSLSYTHKLQKLYSSFHDSTSLKTRFEKKYILLYQYVHGVDSIFPDKKNIYRSIAREAIRTKNAYFISFIQYDSRTDYFENEFRKKFNSNLKNYMIWLKEKYPSNHFGF